MTATHKSFSYHDFKNQGKFIEGLDEAPWDTACFFDVVEDIIYGWYSILTININVLRANRRLSGCHPEFYV